MPQMEKNTVKDTVKELLSFSYEYWFPFEPEKKNNNKKPLQSAAAYKVMIFFVLHSGPIKL